MKLVRIYTGDDGESHVEPMDQSALPFIGLQSSAHCMSSPSSSAQAGIPLTPAGGSGC